MLRIIFVFGIILTLAGYSLGGPFYLLLFYLWDSYFRPEVWLWTDYVSVLRIPLIVGALLVISSLMSRQRIRMTRLTVLILLFLADALFTTVTSEHFAASMEFWIEFAKIIVIALLITALVDDRKRLRVTLLVIALSLGFEQIKQGWAQLVLNPGAANNNPHPVLGDNNGVAVGVLMLVPIFLALAQTAATRWERYFHRFAAAGLVYRAISTYSRGGLLSGVALGLVTLWRSPKRIQAAVGVVLVTAVVLAVMPAQFWARMDTITQGTETTDDSAQGRLFYWSVAMLMGNAKPLTGVGFNASKEAFASYDPTGGAWGSDRAIHSTWFALFAEMGYPGLIVFIAILGTAFWYAGRARKRSRDPACSDLRAYAGAFQAMYVVFVVGTTFLNGQYTETFWHLLGLTIALDGLTAPVVAAASAPVPTTARNAPQAVLRPTAATGLTGVQSRTAQR
jgi:probable O-glycosylation ligase (exosortase A-associated)